MAASKSDSLASLGLNLSLLQILSLSFNAILLGSGNQLTFYQSFCNIGDCYRSAMDALARGEDLDPYLREDIAMGAKAGQLEYIAQYLNETQPEHQLVGVFQTADNIVTSQLSEQGLLVKKAVTSRSKCLGLRYGYISDDPSDYE